MVKQTFSDRGQVLLHQPTRWILQHASPGAVGSEAAEEVSAVERFCCGSYLNPCLSPGQTWDLWVTCRRDQAAITKMLAEEFNTGVLC